MSRAPEILEERRTLLIVRDLLVGMTRFNELMATGCATAPLISMHVPADAGSPP